MLINAVCYRCRVLIYASIYLTSIQYLMLRLCVSCVMCIKKNTWKELTSNFVPDEFAGLNLPDGRKQRPDLLLSHGLGQIIYDEISLWIFGWSSCLHRVVHIPILLLRRNRGGVHAIHLDHWKRNKIFTWHN